jgi:hypothetical protein
MLRNSWVAAELAAPPEGLSSMSKKVSAVTEVTQSPQWPGRRNSADMLVLKPRSNKRNPYILVERPTPPSSNGKSRFETRACLGENKNPSHVSWGECSQKWLLAKTSSNLNKKMKVLSHLRVVVMRSEQLVAERARELRGKEASAVESRYQATASEDSGLYECCNNLWIV